MAKFRYLYGGDEAEWDEHLYHRSLPVRNGIVETDDELDIDALLRRGWERVEENDAPAQKRPAKAAAADE